mmetsp:Transcript_22539/g.57480  ORF Transcript_22539/g.57480 Transcript_22539/m.57480 type:complete len:228 (+) Transcript_22539:356-1039(+)
MLRQTCMLHPSDRRIVRRPPLLVPLLRLHKKLIVLVELPGLDALPKPWHVHVSQHKIFHDLLDFSYLLLPDRLQPLQRRPRPHIQCIILAEIPRMHELLEKLDILVLHCGLQHLGHPIVLVLVRGLPSNTRFLGVLGVECPPGQRGAQVLHVPPLLRPVQPRHQLVPLLAPLLGLAAGLAEDRCLLAEGPSLHSLQQPRDGLRGQACLQLRHGHIKPGPYVGHQGGR